MSSVKRQARPLSSCRLLHAPLSGNSSVPAGTHSPLSSSSFGAIATPPTMASMHAQPCAAAASQTNDDSRLPAHPNTAAASHMAASMLGVCSLSLHGNTPSPPASSHRPTPPTAPSPSPCCMPSATPRWGLASCMLTVCRQRSSRALPCRPDLSWPRDTHGPK